MIVDLHNHTSLCNHAEGTIEEYIEKAIDNKTKYFGFSDHAPMDFDPKYRMSFSQMKTYEKNVLDAKEKYKDKIEILLAYEVDYLDGYMDKRVLDVDVDYLIGSVHFIDKWGFDNPEFIGKYEEMDIDEIWEKYFNSIEDMARSKLFDVVGHIDLIKVFKFLPKKPILEIAKNALHAIKEADMVVELNAAGFRKPIAEAYPSMEILEYMYKLDIPITFASDAHSPEQVGFSSDKLIEMAKSVGYKECAVFKNRKRQLLEF
ncbi:histidinol-phosphatase [Sulfurimonas sp.]|uniref:histidinol-phosphatase n=1 Tax=Sulfurimonas sp. TaxID=2022749 RepID=UPI003563A66A